MRRSEALLLLALVGGCRASPTSLDVSVYFDDTLHRPASLAVTIFDETTTLRMRTTSAFDTRPVRNADDFLVILPDALNGHKITVEVATLEDTAPSIRGSASAFAALHETRPLRVDLGLLLDGGVDLAVPVDLARQDALSCGTTCEADAGEETYCLPDGAMAHRHCGFGCKGAACLMPNTCVGTSEADISTMPGGSYADNTSGLTRDAFNESCAVHTGPDAVMKLGLSDWSNVTIDTAGSSFDTVLFLRTVCSDASSELPAGGPCLGASMVAGAMTCSDDAPDLKNGASKLVLCGLPPRDFDVWLAAKNLGGDYNLNVAITPISLETCPEAGQLVQNWNLEATTQAHGNNFSSDGKGSCSLDRGQNSPDAVFYFALTATHDVMISTEGTTFPHSLYVRKGACGEVDIDCDLAITPPAKLALPGLTPGVYFVILDGINGSYGPLTITLTYTK